MLIRLSELRALIGEVLTEAEKKKEKSNWVPPWLNKSKDDKRAKNEAADAGKKEDAKPAAKKEEPKAPEAQANKSMLTWKNAGIAAAVAGTSAAAVAAYYYKDAIEEIENIWDEWTNHVSILESDDAHPEVKFGAPRE